MYYKQFADFLQKYEDGSEKSAGVVQDKAGVNQTMNVKLVSGDTKAHLKNKLDDLGKDL